MGTKDNSKSLGHGPHSAQAITVTSSRLESPVSELAEIEIFGTQSVTADDFFLGLIARFDSVRVSSPDWAYAVTARLERAVFQLRPVGCDVAHQGRAGDEARPLSRMTDISIQTAAESGQAASAAAEARLGFSLITGPSAGVSSKAGLGFGAKRRTHVVAKSKVREVSRCLTALPGNRWQIEDVDRETLFARYSPDDHLCTVVPKELSGSVAATLYCFPKDLRLDATGEPTSPKLFPHRPNNISVAKALMAKHLRELNDDQKSQDGRLNLARSEVTFRMITHED